MAILVIDSVTSNSVTAYIDELDTSYSRNDRYVDWLAFGESGPAVSSGRAYLNAYVPQGGNITLTGLQPSTMYNAWADIYYSDGLGNWLVTVATQFFTTTGGDGTRPPLFYWSNYGASPTSSTTTIFLPRATALNGLSGNIRLVQAYKSKSQTAFPTVYVGQNFVSLVNQQAGEINTLNGWAYLSTIPTNGAPSSNYMLNMQTYINNIT